MDDKRIYIEQEIVRDALYTHLQEHTLNELQRLSGEVWTDFNVHDPGITLADISNYVLTEMDYKLGFELPDYLTDRQGKLDFAKYGLFLPDDVYTTAPVTVKDYRKLFIAHFPELQNIRVEADTGTGNYTLKIVLSPFEKESRDVENKIKKFFHAHRNLCEDIKDVKIVNPEQLMFEAAFEIETGCDATGILAMVYWTIMQYLSGSIGIETPEKCLYSDLSLEDWMEGTENGTRVTIPEQKDTEHELYLLLCKVSGIKSFSTCYLKNKGVILTDFKEGYSLFIPHNLKDMEKVRITVGNSDVKVDVERFFEELQGLYYTRGASREKADDTWNGKAMKQIENSSLPMGAYRDIFTHYPTGMDLPGCYQACSGIVETPISSEEKGSFWQLDAYLRLYDLLVQRGLKEVMEIPSLLSIRKDTATLSDMDLLGPEIITFKDGKDRHRNVFDLKSKYLDFLDGLYGLESNPAWMKELDYYGENRNEELLRRMDFLRNAAFLTKYRGKARNITEWRDGENVPTVKKHLCYLLGMSVDEEQSVGNVLPGHSLALMGTGEKGRQLRNRLNAMLISERMLDQENIEMVESVLLGEEDITLEKYDELRSELDIFNSNLISGGLFRGGINLNNYKLVKAGKEEYMLVFRNEEEDQWMNLERSRNRDKLCYRANLLRHYLRELNRECETVYVIEHNLFLSPVPFTLSFVFPKWTARFRSPRFREICGELVRSLIPPHLKASLYWLNIQEMQFFESGYRLWRKELAGEILSQDRVDIEEGLMAILEESQKKGKVRK